MADSYYKPCKELDICNALIENYYNTHQYDKCFEGHLTLAQQGYPLAECQVGYFYAEGLGVEKDQDKALYWTRRSAEHGNRDAQCNLAYFYEHSFGVDKDMEQAIFWYRQAARQGKAYAMQRCNDLTIELNAIPTDDRITRQSLQCRIFPLGYLERYKYTVICSSYHGKWILSKHKKRDTWEPQGGHIESGETPLACAKRELYEESGIKDADIYPVCDYFGFDADSFANGMVFLAVVHTLGELPESEMKAIKVFDTLPTALTYPNTSPVFFKQATKKLNDLTKKEQV